MQFIRNFFRKFPRLKNAIKTILSRLQGLPPITFSDISKEFLREVVGKENPIILEIGCNDGTHTLWFLEAFKNPTVYCFEPDPRAIARFKANIGNRTNVHLFELALSDQEGELTFYQSTGKPDDESADIIPEGMNEGWDLSGSIRQPKEHLEAYPWVKFDTSITVPTTTLDSWCKQQGIAAIDFIWMDVQGAEIDVFRGGTDALAATQFIYTEYSDRQLYSGQFTLKQLLGYLQHFDVLVRYAGDIFLKKKR
jgi:2-O-methyltransferase